MEETIATRAPLHLWLVGIVAALWNGFGCADYLMTRTRNDAWITGMMPGTDPQDIYAYIASFPLWASFGWGLGVWLGLAGALLLLARHRWAVPALGLSFIGAVLGLGWQLANPPNVGGMHEGANAWMPAVIIAVALALFVYARALRAKGVLR